MLDLAVRKRRSSFLLDARLRAPVPGIVALFGRSGCGKTTLIEVIAGLLDPDEGYVRLGDRTLTDTSAGTRVAVERRRIGYVFQDARLFPHYDVLGNLRYGERRARGAPRVIELAEVVSLLGLAPLLDRRPGELSGGERQRVALGRALLCQPQLLLLDEPLAALDRPRREEVLPYLEALRDRLAIPMVYVSHQYEEVLRLATHLALMDHGRIIAQGTPEEMSLRPELRAIVGPDGVGAVIDGVVEDFDRERFSARVRLGRGRLQVRVSEARPGARMRVQLLARDLIIATEAPRALSVRNVLEGTVVELAPDEERAMLVQVDIGGPRLLSRLTEEAVAALTLRPGARVYVLVKAVSTRGHAFQLG